MKNVQRGFTMIEVLSALAIGAMMMIGLSALIDNSLEDTKAEQAAHYQSQVGAAAGKYISERYLELVGATTPADPVPISLAALRADGYLPAGFQDTNAWGQTPCVLVLRRTITKPDGSTAEHLDALIVTEGGTPIPDRIAPFVAANAGQGGGHLVTEAGNLVARGAFGATVVTGAALGNFLKTSCTGTIAGTGHLASTLFYDGPGRLTTDFLYRDAVPNQPELNRMTTPLQILLAVDAVENSTTDPLCAAGDVNSQGRFVVNRNGVILTCQAGKWKRPPTLHWREPVISHAALLALPAADNQSGDVRMVQDLGRAFTWKVPGPTNASGDWVALAVDQNGNMTVENTLTTKKVVLNETVSKDTACSPNGSLSRDASGMVLTCKSGLWRSLLDTRITSSSLFLSTTYTPGDGVQNYNMALPAATTGPLYISGFTHCNSLGGSRVLVAIELYDSSNNRLGYAGGCGAQSEPDGKVLTKGFIALQKIPSNVSNVRVYVEPGSIGGDYGLMEVYIYTSE